MRGLVCSSATAATLDSIGQDGRTRPYVGTDGLGLISYRDQTNGHLKVAHCVDVVCSSAADWDGRQRRLVGDTRP